MSFLSCEEMLAAARSQNISLSEAILRSDLAESRLTEAHSREMMHHLWQVMQATSRDYDPAQRSRSGLSGGDAARVEQAHQEGKSLGGDYLAAVTAEALKTAECNACMKRIVAAPTAGSCGVLPAVLLPLARSGEADEESICDALYVPWKSTSEQLKIPAMTAVFSLKQGFPCLLTVPHYQSGLRLLTYFRFGHFLPLCFPFWKHRIRHL